MWTRCKMMTKFPVNEQLWTSALFQSTRMMQKEATAPKSDASLLHYGIKPDTDTDTDAVHCWPMP